MAEPESNKGLTYERKTMMGEGWYEWYVDVEGTRISGTASSVRQAYRKARRRIRLHRKLLRVINKKAPRNYGIEDGPGPRWL